MSFVDECIKKVITIAEDEVGYLEKKTNSSLYDDTANAGQNNYTKFAKELDNISLYGSRKNGYSWCNIFVHWCLIKAFGVENAMKIVNQISGRASASCTTSAKYYKNVGRFFHDPKPGDQMFFLDTDGSMAHTGLVVEVKNGRVYTIEGNTSSASGVVANGGGVARKSYALNYAKIGGYGRPDYAAIDYYEEDDEDMNIERFKELMKEYRIELQDNDSANWSNEARDWAVSNGIVQGNSSTEFNGMWEDFLTREQMVTLLYRFAKLMGKA